MFLAYFHILQSEIFFYSMPCPHIKYDFVVCGFQQVVVTSVRNTHMRFHFFITGMYLTA